MLATYEDAPTEIPDGNSNGVNIPIEVAGFTGLIRDLKFKVGGTSCATDLGAGISHTWDADLRIKLTSPQGTTITLLDNVGENGHNICNLVLDDAATAGSVQHLRFDNAPLTGTFQPRDPLAAFRGENPNGIWILNVSDRVAGETGAVRDVSLEISGKQLLRGYCGTRSFHEHVGHTGCSGSQSRPDLLTEGYNGPVASTNVQVVDTLPAGVNVVGLTSSQGSCNQTGNVVTCNLGDLRPFGVASINIVVRPQNDGALSNSATVNSSESDPELSNNTAATTNQVTRLADLIIRNNDSPDPIPLGGSTTYTITVTNRGPSPATGVTVHTQLPSGGTQTNVIGNLAVNGSATLSIGGSGSAPGTIIAQASVTANQVDPQPDNNFAAQSTRVVTLHSVLLQTQQLSGCPGNAVFGRTTGTVRLNSKAPAGGAVVTLVTGNPKISIPSSVTVPAGESFADFTISVNGTVLDPQTGQISATYAGTTRSQSITVRPISVASITTPLNDVTGGQSFSAHAVLECHNSPVPITVMLSTDLPSVAFISSPTSGTVTIPAGQLTSSSFTVQTNPVVTETFVHIEGTANGRTGSGLIRVKP